MINNKENNKDNTKNNTVINDNQVGLNTRGNVDVIDKGELNKN